MDSFKVLGLDLDYLMSSLTITEDIVRNGLSLRSETWCTWMDFNDADFVLAPLVEANASNAKVHSIIKAS